MFNKKSKMIIGCLAFLLALSVGYALFSDTINVSGKATANASLDVTATCTKGFNSELTGSNIQGEGLDTFGFNEEYGFSNESCSVNGNTVNINLNLDYPGATRYYTIKFTNNGTIPAQINVFDDDNVEGSDVRNKSVMKRVDASGTVVDSVGFDGIDLNSFMEHYPGVVFVGYKAPSGNIYVTDISEAFSDDNKNTLIYPGGSLYAIISAPWSSDDDLNNFKTGGTYLEYDLSFEFNFSQPSNETIKEWDSIIDQM